MNNKVNNGWKYGVKLGRIICGLRSNFYWLSMKLRKRKYYNMYEKDKKEYFVLIRQFIKGLFAFNKLSLIKCESCENVGIDYKSEKHGWKYHGYHIWSCPKCKEKEDAKNSN